MTHLKYWLVVLLAVILAGCASPRVDWDYDTSAAVTSEMSQWKTYAWVEKKEDNKATSYQLDGLMDRRIRAAIEQGLAAKGYKKVDTADADFLVNYLTTTKTRREEDQVTTSLGYGLGAWGSGIRVESRVREYEEGSLVLDFVDPKTKELAWRGRSFSRVTERSTPEKRTEKINSAVQAILAGFPPGKQN